VFYKTFLLSIFYFLFVNISFADDSCLFFKYCGDGSQRSSKSMPSTAAAGSMNPSNISSVKGFGLETLYQSGNPLGFNVVSGNGKIGALISPTLENSFFGNRTIEIDDVYLVRRLSKKQYDNTKLNLSLGAKLLDKKYAGIDLGFAVKRNPAIKNLNPGIGMTCRLAFLHFGAYFYKDDVKVPLGNYINPYTNLSYSSIYANTNYQEKFFVDTYTAGTSFKNLSFDAGIIKTRYQFYPDNTRIYLYSWALVYNKFLFNIATRKEYSSNENYVDRQLQKIRKKSESFFGLKYSFNSHLTLGLQYNNFLIHEWSSSLTIFL
jgi:hypothetical protein